MQQQQNNKPLDKGLIRVVVSWYEKKERGLTVYKEGTNQPIMVPKYATIGEVTRWPSDNGDFYDSVEFYLGFTILDMNRNGRIFWDSQKQQQAPQGGFQQQQPQAGGFQPR